MRYSRRQVTQAALSSLFAMYASCRASAGSRIAAQRPAAGPGAGQLRHSLWYKKPAQSWVEALPVGNGRLAAMIYGGVPTERLQLNEGTLWAGAPYDPSNPEALVALPEVRRLLDVGKFKEATELVMAKMMAKPLSQMPYSSAGALTISFPDHGAAEKYERRLELADAITSTRYSVSRHRYGREMFVSEPDQVIVSKFTVSRGVKLDIDIAYDYAKRVAYAGAPSANGSMYVDWLGNEPGRNIPPTERPISLKIEPDGRNAMLVTGTNVHDSGIAAGLRFAIHVRVVHDGGTAEYADEMLRVRGAREVVLLVAVATSFVTYNKVDGDPQSAVRVATDAAARKPYAQLKRDHIASHRKLYEGVDLQLAGGATRALPTDEAIRAIPAIDDPSQAELYFQFGRYLLISSSRRSGQPANLQGLWNEGLNPPWGSKYTININTEMNYWPCEPAGLQDCFEPFVRMVEDLAVTGAHVAKVNYGAGGWVAHHNTDLWRAAAPIDGPQGMWPCGGAWLCKHLWDHYDYGRDLGYLRRVYPLMKGATQFFLDVLVEDDKGRGLVTSPSVSPEHEHHPGLVLCAGPAMDRQILRDLFDACVAAAELLQVDADFRTRVADTRQRLAPDQIGTQGQLQEWMEDWDAQAPDVHHRHVSHLYALYPSDQINVRDTPELAKAARKSLEIRGDEATGWGIAWRLNLWARLGEAEHAYHILKLLTGPERTYPNMFDAHPPFQIDGNFGGVSGILEMIVQSWGGEIHLLPALPAAWPEGRVKGVRCRGAVTLDMRWQQGRLQSVSLSGVPESEHKLRYQGGMQSVRLDGNGTAVITFTRVAQ